MPVAPSQLVKLHYGLSHIQSLAKLSLEIDMHELEQEKRELDLSGTIGNIAVMNEVCSPGSQHLAQNQ